ncbi:MAG: UPF0147 family protein [Candidatus Diapherotrites archaeon]
MDKKGNDDAREYVFGLMDAVIEDTSVPKNIRAAVNEAREKIGSSAEVSVGVTSALYILDDISNDINMPSHTRTEIWTIISELESIRERNK